MPRAKTFDEQQVLNQAMELFWERGYAATSIQDLVTHLGVSRASLYDTYGGKEELFNKAFSSYRKQGLDHVSSLFQSEPDVRKGFQKLFNGAITESVQDPSRKGCFAVNTTTELIPGNDAIAATLLENKNAMELAFFNYLKSGVAAKQLSSDKDWKTIAEMLFMQFNGLRVVAKIEPDQSKLRKSMDLALSLLD